MEREVKANESFRHYAQEVLKIYNSVGLMIVLSYKQF